MQLLISGTLIVAAKKVFKLYYRYWIVRCHGLSNSIRKGFSGFRDVLGIRSLFGISLDFIRFGCLIEARLYAKRG